LTSSVEFPLALQHFFTDEFDDAQRSLSPESIALWAERAAEYEAFVAAG
jgi:hypothetical protein